MATTTNYSWSTPDDTALVKDGAAAIRSLGTAIDSTVFTNAGAAINKSIVDAAGDLIYGTADNTVARLAIGTADQVLKVNSGATAPEWVTFSSGGMTLISTTTLSGVTTTLSSIPQTYNHLYLDIELVTGNTANSTINVLPNNVAGCFQQMIFNNAVTDSSSAPIRITANQTTNRTDSRNTFNLIINNYSSTAGYKPFASYGMIRSGDDGNNALAVFGMYRETTAVTSLVFNYGGTNTFAGGTVRLYGVK
jgi:hypothetical protein